MRVFIEDSFDSAHWLPNVPVSHKCRNLHGHTYRIRLEFSGEVDAMTGWVVDYADVKEAWERVKEVLDHRCINDVIDNPTCENVAVFVMSSIGSVNGAVLSRVEIRETERCGVVLECL